MREKHVSSSRWSQEKENRQTAHLKLHCLLLGNQTQLSIGQRIWEHHQTPKSASVYHQTWERTSRKLDDQRLTWFRRKAARRCCAPSGPILLCSRFSVLSVCDHRRDRTSRNMLGTASPDSSPMLRLDVGLLHCRYCSTKVQVLWVSVIIVDLEIREVYWSMSHLVHPQGCTKMLRSFSADTVALKIEHGEGLWLLMR